MRFLLTALISIVSVSLYGQIYSGITNKSTYNTYNCLIRINKDSTINFIYDRDNYGVYNEQTGTIRRLTDTTYHIASTVNLFQHYMKTPSEDTLYIKLDSSIARQLDKIEVEYSDKQTRKLFQGYDSTGKALKVIEIPVEKHLFNRTQGKNYIRITINRKHPINGKWLSFKIPFGASAFFSKGEKVEFDVLIKNNVLQTIGEAPPFAGTFTLKRR